MRFFKFLRFDLVNGTKQSWKPFFGSMLFLAFVGIDFLWKVRQWNGLEEALEKTGFTLGDLALFLFGGMKEYIPDPNNPFLVPTLWLLFFFLVCFSTCYYPYDDLSGFGQQVLLYSGGRACWWLSKALWNILTVTGYFCLTWLFLLAIATLGGGHMSFGISWFMVPQFMLENQMSEAATWDLTAQLLLAPWLVALSLSLLQMLVSLLIRPVFSLIVTACHLIASAYLCSPLLIGNYAILVRDSQILPDKIQFPLGIVLCLGLIVGSVLGGLLIFRRKDLLPEEV